MLLDDSGVLDRHLPASERHHSRAQRKMLLVERRTLQLFRHSLHFLPRVTFRHSSRQTALRPPRSTIIRGHRVRRGSAKDLTPCPHGADPQPRKRVGPLDCLGSDQRYACDGLPACVNVATPTVSPLSIGAVTEPTLTVRVMGPLTSSTDTVVSGRSRPAPAGPGSRSPAPRRPPCRLPRAAARGSARIPSQAAPGPLGIAAARSRCRARPHTASCRRALPPTVPSSQHRSVNPVLMPMAPA